MGNCSFKSEQQEKTSTLSISNLQFLYVIGRGGFGKVWKVERKKTKQLYALKEISKSRVITKKSVNSVMNERQLLSQIRHSFIVNMIYAFQDRENLYLIMDLMPGGDLRYHLAKEKKFSEETTKFLICCILVTLEYLHSNGIIHRDVKPENLVFDDKGYLRLTDFGIARLWRPDNSADTSGTPGYMAPEVMCRQNHGVAVDYYALGVIAYECMMGKRPYVGKTRKEIRDQILAKQVQIKRNEIPEGWSLEAADFINKLIQRKPINRLGLDGPSTVKNHPWLANFPWQKLTKKELQSPYLPAPGDNYNNKEKSGLDENSYTDNEVDKQNALLLRRNSVQVLFEGYNYDSTTASLLPITNASTNPPSNNSNQTGKSFEKQLSLDVNQQFTDKDEEN